MKIKVEPKTTLLTHPAFVIGSYSENKVPNMVTVSWGGICCSEPPCVAISLRKLRHSYSNIMYNKAFTVNIPSEKYIRETDYCGIISGKNENKFDSTKLTAVDSELVNAPYIKEFPLSMLCEVVNTIELGSHTQFIGKIIEVLADEEIFNAGGMPDILTAKPFFYDTSSRSYYKVGERLLSAFTTRKI